MQNIVRKYSRKKTLLTYNKGQLNETEQAVQSGTLTLDRAALAYKIPKSTIFTHVKGTKAVKSSSGRMELPAMTIL